MWFRFPVISVHGLFLHVPGQTALHPKRPFSTSEYWQSLYQKFLCSTGADEERSGWWEVASLEVSEEHKKENFPAFLIFRTQLFWHGNTRLAWRDLSWLPSPNSSMLTVEHTNGCSGLPCCFSNYQCQSMLRTGAKRWSTVHGHSTLHQPHCTCNTGSSPYLQPEPEGWGRRQNKCFFTHLPYSKPHRIFSLCTHVPTSMFTFKTEASYLFCSGTSFTLSLADGCCFPSLPSDFHCEI